MIQRPLFFMVSSNPRLRNREKKAKSDQFYFPRGGVILSSNDQRRM